MTKENIKIADLESEELLTPLSLANPIEIPKHEPALATKRWFIYFLGTMPTTGSGLSFIESILMFL